MNGRQNCVAPQSRFVHHSFAGDRCAVGVAHAPGPARSPHAPPATTATETASAPAAQAATTPAPPDEPRAATGPPPHTTARTEPPPPATRRSAPAPLQTTVPLTPSPNPSP